MPPTLRVGAAQVAPKFFDKAGSLTLCNTLVFVGRDGRLLGRHRKLMPTHSERVYWGMGDANDIRVFDMDIGRVGGLICYEHHMTLLRAAMAIKGEEIHCAVWPGWWAVERHLGAKRPEPGARSCDIEPAIREYAIENQAFVVSSSWYLPPGEIPPALVDEMKYNLEEAIVWAEERRLAKAYLDCLGHSVRFDLLSLNIRGEVWTPTGPKPIEGGGHAAHVHNHILSREYADLLARFGGHRCSLARDAEGRTVVMRAGARVMTCTEPMFDPELRLRAMDEVGVAIELLSYICPNASWPEGAPAAEVARVMNDHLAEELRALVESLLASLPAGPPDA